MAKHSFYQKPRKNAKYQDLLNEFQNYKCKNDVKVSAINDLRAENARLREALEKIAYSTGFKELYQAEAFATQVLEGVSK